MPRAPRLRRLAVAVALVVAGIAGMLVGLAPPASAAGTLTSLGWSASSTGSGVTGVGYTYFFTTASTAVVQTVTMTVPTGTGGTPAVGTVTPSSLTAGGDSVSLAGGTLTFTSTAHPSINASTPVSIQITGLTNTSTPGSYTSLVSTKGTTGSLVDSGTTPAVTISSTLVPPPAGQWLFSEGSGTTTADSSGNGHTGTLGAGASWAPPGVGANSIADNHTPTGVITVSGPVINTAASYTASAWVYLNSPILGGNQTFVSITGLASPVGNTLSGFFLQFQPGSNDNFAFTVRVADATGSTFAAQALGPSNVVSHTWYHIVGVYNSVAQTIALYINGVLAQTTAYTTPWQATGGLPPNRQVPPPTSDYPT